MVCTIRVSKQGRRTLSSDLKEAGWMKRGAMSHLNSSSSYRQNNALSPAVFIYFIFILDCKFIVSHNQEEDSFLDF